MPANFPSKKHPFYTELVDDDGNVLGTSANPLVTTAQGSGGGAEQVTITSTSGGDAVTADASTDGTANSQVGMLVNAREFVYDPTAGNWDRMVSDGNGRALVKLDGAAGSATTRQGNADGAAATDVGIVAMARLMASNGTTWDRLQVDANKALRVTDVGSPTITANVLNVTTAGARVQLPNVNCKEVTIIAKSGNSSTSSIYLGGSNVSSSVYGAALGPKDSITLKVSNANILWIDASENGIGISYIIL